MTNDGKREPVRAALIAADESLRTNVSRAVEATHGQVEIGLETDSTPEDLLREPMTPIQQYDPQVIFLDLGPEADDGIRLAGILTRSNPGVGIIACGPELPRDQLVEAMRSGISEVMDGQPSVEDLTDAIDRLLHRMGLAGGSVRRASGKVMAFVSPKGGTGCTTVAMNVGIDLHRLTGKKTLLVDLDLELGEIASFMGLKPRFHLVDLLKNFHRMDEDLLTSYIERHESGVHVLSAPFQPETGQEVTPEQISSVLSFLRHQYDYVVVDTSKSLAPPALAAMQPADDIFVVTNLDLCSVRNLKRSMPILKDMTPDGERRIRLIVNRYSKNALVSLDDLESTVGLSVYGTLSNDFKTVIESLSTGRPLVLHGNARYAQEIESLASKIAGRAGAKKRRMPLLGRLFKKTASSRRIDTSREAMNHA
ncbi:MAG: AAA family ATPase [Gemmatimonadota bacterium]|jgi:pilus assembly protein CpaE